jgi:hypothetical protein
VNGKSVIVALKKKLRVGTDHDLASRLGLTGMSIQNWKNRSRITPRQIAGLIHSASKAATNDFQMTALRPLVEFFKIQKCDSPGGAKYKLFDIKDNRSRPHPYRTGLKNELDKFHGVYVFFDSRGQAIYTGKARRQSLWKEMTGAFNRDRDSVQKIKRVRHPERRVHYRTSDEKSRQIVEYSVPLHELAAYFSAYHVADGMIDELESLLVRSFANDLLNIRMERFGRQRKALR